nr:15317_t:CDS:2 [Entrophospora candida]
MKFLNLFQEVTGSDEFDESFDDDELKYFEISTRVEEVVL